MSVTLTYNLIGRGSLHCIVSIDGREGSITANYMSDCLDDLLRATTAILRGQRDVKVLFCEPPGEYRLKLDAEGERLSMRILWFKDTFSRLSDDHGELIFAGECRLRTFAGAVLAAAQKVFDEYGLDGYRAIWPKADFPMDSMTALKATLRATRGGA